MRFVYFSNIQRIFLMFLINFFINSALLRNYRTTFIVQQNITVTNEMIILDKTMEDKITI